MFTFTPPGVGLPDVMRQRQSLILPVRVRGTCRSGQMKPEINEGTEKKKEMGGRENPEKSRVT